MLVKTGLANHQITVVYPFHIFHALEFHAVLGYYFVSLFHGTVHQRNNSLHIFFSAFRENRNNLGVIVYMSC
ncbi:hypothetical protein SDC9_68777 [bioreactor metagenome]|uniref:Uncharacterized protein n=1 Tax=bioreactor metagenome TaxID=1076179 RepID=A0A644Y1D4_9ZZZZ